MINILDFILSNFRQRVHWCVCQNNHVLANGAADKNEVFDEIKRADIHIPTDQEIAEQQRRREEAYRKRKAALAKKKAATKKETPKIIEELIKEKDEKLDSKK